MASRYGRKQRRAAREMIEAQAAQIAKFPTIEVLYQKKVRGAEAQREFLLDRIRLWDSEIRSLLGPYTSFSIEEPTYRVDHPDQIRQMPVIPPLTFRGVSEYSMQEVISYTIETMLGFMCGLDERILERLRRLMTVRVVVGSERYGNEAYWAVTETQWREMKAAGPNSPGLERFIQRIAGDLVRLLVAPPKKKPSGDDLVPVMERDMQRHSR